MNQGDSVEATFCFVDLAGYTALTDSHGEYAAADVIEVFEDLLTSALGNLGTVHELTGDCAFLVFPKPTSSIMAVRKLFQLIDERPNFPVVRAGLHRGTALLRNGRYFGSSINLAARVSAQANGGQVLCTESLVSALSEQDAVNLQLKPLGKFSLRNFPEPVNLFEVLSETISLERVIDPVCQMQVDPDHAAGKLVVNERQYFFCSLECVERFAHSPSSFIDVRA